MCGRGGGTYLRECVDGWVGGRVGESVCVCGWVVVVVRVVDERVEWGQRESHGVMEYDNVDTRRRESQRNQYAREVAELSR